MLLRPPRSTRTDTLFPYTTLFRSVGGLALHDGGEGSRWLLASDASAGRINVYDRNRDDAYAGSFVVAAAGGDAAIGEPGPLFASGRAIGTDFPNGLLLVDRKSTRLNSRH